MCGGGQTNLMGRILNPLRDCPGRCRTWGGGPPLEGTRCHCRGQKAFTVKESLSKAIRLLVALGVTLWVILNSPVAWAGLGRQHSWPRRMRLSRCWRKYFRGGGHDARTSLATTLRMVRSVSMTNVVRLTAAAGPAGHGADGAEPRGSRLAPRRIDVAWLACLGAPRTARTPHRPRRRARIVNERCWAKLGRRSTGRCDAHPLAAHPGEFVAQVPKMTNPGLYRSARTPTGRRTAQPGVGKECGQFPRPTGVVVQGEVRRLLARDHRQRVTRGSSARRATGDNSDHRLIAN